MTELFFSVLSGSPCLDILLVLLKTCSFQLDLHIHLFSFSLHCGEKRKKDERERALAEKNRPYAKKNNCHNVNVLYARRGASSHGYTSRYNVPAKNVTA